MDSLYLHCRYHYGVSSCEGKLFHVRFEALATNHFEFWIQWIVLFSCELGTWGTGPPEGDEERCYSAEVSGILLMLEKRLKCGGCVASDRCSALTR